MWPSNHQQWSTMPNASPNSTPQTNAGGQQGVGYGDYQQQQYQNQNPHYQQQQYQIQNQDHHYQHQQYQMMQNQMISQQQYQMQNQIIPQHQQLQQVQATTQYYANTEAMDPRNNVGMANNYTHVPPPPPLPHDPRAGGIMVPPPPPPRPMIPPPPPNQQQFYCGICKIACPNEFSLHQHVNGDKHRRQEVWFKSNNHRSGTNPQDSRARPSPFHCEICNVSCRAELSFQQHLNGDKHRKKAAAAAVGGPQSFVCQVCYVSCPNQLSYDQHLIGEKHRRQVAIVGTRNDNIEKVFHCRLCNVSCPNDFSYQQHMYGERHKKQVATVSANSNAAGEHSRQVDTSSTTSNAEGQHQAASQSSHCEVCRVSCTNDLSYQQHLNGKKHKKKVAAFALGMASVPSNISTVGSALPSSAPLGTDAQVQNEAAEPAEPDVKEIRPVASKPIIEDEDSEEEGEIDEEKEDIDNFYDELGESEMATSSSAQEASLSQPNDENRGGETDGADSDVDDMFGGDEDDQVGDEQKPSSNEEPIRTDDNIQQPQEIVNGESSQQGHEKHGEKDEIRAREEMDMFGGENEVLDDDNPASSSNVPSRNGVDKSHGTQHVKQLVEDEISVQSNDQMDEIDYEEMEMFEDVDEIGDNVGRSTVWNIEKVQQLDIDKCSNRIPERKNSEDDAMDMFGEGDDGEIDENINQTPSPVVLEALEAHCESSPKNDVLEDAVGIEAYEGNMENIGNIAKQEAPTMLDSGLGFVLDYSPDTPIDSSTEGQNEPEPSNAHTPKSCTQTPQVEDDEVDIEVDMFGDSSDVEDNDIITSHISLELVNDLDVGELSIKTSSQLEDHNKSEYANDPNQTPRENQQDDEMDMFGHSTDEDEINTKAPMSPQISSQNVDHTAADPQKSESGAAMTASEALAAARRRHSSSKLPAKQIQGKRARNNTAHQGRPILVKLPEKIPHYDLSTRSYYPPVHSDKYWSELRNWDFVKELNDLMKNNGPASKKREKGTKRALESNGDNGKESDESGKAESLPNVFESVAQYKSLWAPLLINEAKAQLLSEVQSSASTMGVAAKVELSRTARDHNSAKSLEATVVVHIRASTKGSAGFGCPVNSNDLLLFVHLTSTIERALRGKAFEAINDEVGNGALHRLPQGRLGFIGHALNHRSRSVDGLLARVSHKWWSQFASLDEFFVIRIGSNVTALREFNALAKADTIPLMQYLLDGKTCNKQDSGTAQKTENGIVNEASEKAPSKFDPLALGENALPVGFRIFIKSKMNNSQRHAITAAATEYGDGGFTLIKGPPGTGKSTTLCSILNALHLRQYQEYYNAIEKIVTDSNASTYYEELAALNKAAEVKPRILVCAPSNAGIDNVILKIMADRFVDGQGTQYSPSIVRVGAGITNPKIDSVSLKRVVESIISQGSDVIKLEQIIQTGRLNLKRIMGEIHKIRARIQAMMECCPYEISSQWEIRIDEAGFESSGRVLFVNHSTKTTTFDIPQPLRPNEKACNIRQMPHYASLLKSLTKYVERHNNESSSLEKYIIVQNAANAKMEGSSDESLTSLLETHVLNCSTHIVLTTLGSAGGRAVESANKFKVVVVDEAAQSAEPSTLVALQLGSSHAILVGDPQQLPATIFSVSGRSTKYDRSMFQRLEEAGHDVHLLNTQYRMNPVISEFPRHIFYEGMLLDGPNVLHPDFGGSLKSMIRSRFPYIQPFQIFDLDSKEERGGARKSLQNKDEAQLVLQLYRTLDRETDGLVAKSRVAVITPYSQQSSLLHRLFNENYGDSYQSRVEISTVDAFQGREAGIVIYSCVRAGGRGSGIGFLSDVQRMNVALTRAKHFLFVIARRRSIMVNPYWRKLVGYARSKSAIIHVPKASSEQKPKSKALRSSLVKSSSVKKAVHFGGVDKRLYDVSSKANPNEEELFPDLASLAPMHNTSNKVDAMSDSECSA